MERGAGDDVPASNDLEMLTVHPPLNGWPNDGSAQGRGEEKIASSGKDGDPAKNYTQIQPARLQTKGGQADREQRQQAGDVVSAVQGRMEYGVHC
jgi:hypothetical protein